MYMNEQEIAAKLQQNLPQPVEPSEPIAQPKMGVGQAEQAMETGLDEMTVYKLHEFFGERYDSNDENSKVHAEYIYEKLGQILGESDYGLIVAKARELERLIGTTNGDRRMYKLYRWLKLDSIRRSTEAQMSALGNR